MALRKSAKDVMWVAGGQYIALLVGIPLGLVTPFFLAPAAYGVMGVIDMISEYLKHYALGTHFSLLRDIPFLRAAGKTQEADDVRDSVWTFTILLSFAIVLVPAALARWVFHAGLEFQLCLLLASIALAGWQIATVPQNIIKAQKRFKTDTGLTVIPALAQIPTLILCLVFLGLPGYFLSQALMAALFLLVCLRYTGEPLRLRFRMSALVVSFGIGIPIFVNGIADSAMATVDRAILQRVFSGEALGLYFFAWRLGRYVLLLPQAVGKVFLPALSAKLGTVADERDLAASVVVPSRFLGHIMAFLIGGAVFVFPALVFQLYPKFRESAPLIPVFFVASWWASVGTIAWKHLLATKRSIPGLTGYVLAIGVVAAGLLALGGGITLLQAALVSAAGIALRSVVIVVFSLGALSRRWTDLPVRAALVMAPFLYLVALWQGIDRGWALWVAPGWSPPPLVTGLAQGALFGLLYAPILWSFYRRHGAFLRAAPPAPESDPEPAPPTP